MSTISNVFKQEAADDFLTAFEKGKLLIIAQGLEQYGKEVKGEV